MDSGSPECSDPSVQSKPLRSACTSVSACVCVAMPNGTPWGLVWRLWLTLPAACPVWAPISRLRLGHTDTNTRKHTSCCAWLRLAGWRRRVDPVRARHLHVAAVVSVCKYLNVSVMIARPIWAFRFLFWFMWPCQKLKMEGRKVGERSKSVRDHTDAGSLEES